MQTTVAAIEQILDAMLRRKLPDPVQRTRRFFGCRREIVIEHKCNAGRIQNRSSSKLLAKNAHDEVGAEIMHHHSVHVRDDDISWLDGLPTARLCQDFFN